MKSDCIEKSSMQTGNKNEHVGQLLPQKLLLPITSAFKRSLSTHYPHSRSNHFRLNFKNKLRTVTKKTEAVNGIIKRIEKGPHRIVRKYVKQRKITLNSTHLQENSCEQVDDFQCQHQTAYNQATSTKFIHSQNHGNFNQNQISTLKINSKDIMQESYSMIQQIIDREKILNNPIKQKTKATFKLVRQLKGWKFFKPEFMLFTGDGKKELVYCKKTSPLTFILSGSKTNFQEDSAEYMGKLVSNISGSLLNLYIRSINQFNKKQEQKLICSIEYTNTYLQFSKPRFIRVYFDNHYGKKFDHSGKVYDSVKQMYEKEHDQSAISVFESKKPVYDKDTKTYKLDFYGRADVSSIKNFILEDINHRGRDYLLFGKNNTNEYNLDIMSPFTPFIAFSICLSAFNGKFICE